MTAPTTAKVRVLFWREVPVQVQAEDETGKVSVLLDPRFQEGADAIAMFDGSYGSEEYLEGWKWTEPSGVEGTAREVAAETAGRYNKGMPEDFVARMTTTETKKQTLLGRLAGGGTLIADGATGTYLQARGLEPGGDPETMNVTNPQVVQGMAAEYLAAGSDLVQTNSFGGNRFMQAKYGYGERVPELNRLAAEHARGQSDKADGTRFVAGSMGPTGELIEPVGETPAGDVYHAFVEQVTALEEGGVDVIVVETMISVEEAKLAVRAVKEHTGLPVAARTTFDKGPRGYFTMMGDTPESAVALLAEAGADILGTNCGNGIDVMVELGERFRFVTTGPIWLNSNAGIPLIRQGQLIYPESPAQMAEGFKKLSDMGVEIVGGCCGTTPAHIRALVEAVRG